MRTTTLLLLSFFFTDLYCQSIQQLGSWSNNANFVTKYINERLIVSTTGPIRILDVSGNGNPVPVGSLTPPAYFPMAITIDGNYAYFGGGMTANFIIADITNIDAPVQSGLVTSISGTGYQLAVSGNYAFMPVNQDTLYSFDISNKSTPFVADRISLGAFGSGIAIKGSYAYVGTAAGLKVINITDPSNLSIVNTLGTNYGMISADLANNRIFAATSTGFDAISLADPVNPAVLFSGSGATSQLVYKNGRVFQFGNSTSSVYEVGSNSAQLLASFSAFNGQLTGIDVKDSVYYVSTVNNVHVLKYSDIPVSISKSKKGEPGFYPNPSNGQVYFINTGKANGYIIRDINTRIIMKGHLSGSSLDISGIPAGTYSLTVTENDKEIKTLKLLKSE